MGEKNTGRDTLALGCADATEQREAWAEIERLHTWEGLMSLLDEYWPDDLIPTREDDSSRDSGPRIVSLIRLRNRSQIEIERLRKENKRLRQRWKLVKKDMCHYQGPGGLHSFVGRIAAAETESEVA